MKVKSKPNRIKFQVLIIYDYNHFSLLYSLQCNVAHVSEFWAAMQMIK
jgi:hypothetical protein